MKVDLHNAGLRVHPQQPLRLNDAKDAAIMVIWGEVWVTQEGDSEDYVLRTGDSKRVERNGLTLIQALGDATVSILRERQTASTKAAEALDHYPALVVPYY